MRQLQSSFRFSSCKSGSWRRYALDFLCWCVDGEVEELVQPGRVGASDEYRGVCFVGLEVGGNYVWCLGKFVIFMGFGGAKRCGDALKSLFGVVNKPQGSSYYGEVSSHYLTLLY